MKPRTTAAALALAFLLAACAPDQSTALRAANPPAGAPRVTGPVHTADQDHLDLLAAFGGEYRSETLGPILDEVVSRLVARSERPDEGFRLTVLDSPKVNAFALPSGRLYLTRGLLALANDPAEIAAVIAHEMAHVTRRHAASRNEQEARSALISRVATDVLGDPAAGARLRDRSRGSLAGFSRAQEFEADEVGIATMASAGYDPYGAARFLQGLQRQSATDASEGGGRPADGMLTSHPATSERLAAALTAARRLAPSGPEVRQESWEEGRERFLAALNGLPYGESPSDGIVRGRRFIHPKLGIAFEAPAGIALENTPRAVLGTTRDRSLNLLFDALDIAEDESLQQALAASWAGGIEPGSARTALVGSHPVAFASARGSEWTFRFAVVRAGATTFRLVLAGRGAAVATLDREQEAVLAGLRDIGPNEAGALRPLRLATVAAAPGDTPESLAARMRTDRPLDLFLMLNGLDRGARLVPGGRYKVVAE